MPWPKMIQLADRQVATSTSGMEIRNTYYVEPTEAAPAVMASLLGWVDTAGGGGRFNAWQKRVLPAQDCEYKQCFCDEAHEVLFDPTQISYMGDLNYQKGGDHRAIKNAVGGVPDYNQRIRPAIMNRSFQMDDKDFAAGVYIEAIFRPLYSALQGSGTERDYQLGFDYINPTLTAQHRTNLINSGLRLRCAKFKIPGWVFTLSDEPMDIAYYPSTGVAPAIEEQYLELTIQRKMCVPTFDFTYMNQYINRVNDGTTVGGDQGGARGLSLMSCPRGTMKFTGYDTEIIRVPAINVATGDLTGNFNQWMNITTHYEIRTLASFETYDLDGAKVNAETPVEWNQMLAYPGDMRMLAMLLSPGGVKNNCGWYFTAFNPGLAGVINPKLFPYPYDDVKNTFEAQ